MGYKLKRILMWVNNTTRGLPAEYQEVEYIQSSGTQRIDTGISAYQYLSFEVDFQFLSNLQDAHPFGARTGSVSNRFGLALYNSSFHMMVGNSSTWNGSFDTNRHTGSVTLNNGVFTSTFDGIASDSGSVGTSVYVNQNFQLFSVNYSSSTGGGLMKLYSFKLYTGSNTLVRDFVPCYRKSDNVIGLYDLVNNQFYTNAGIGTFTKGSDVPDMVEKQVYPAGWKPGANTIAYYKLKSNTNDTMGTYNLTNSGITFGDLGGVICANFNSSASASGSFYAYGTGNFTASVWGYPTSTSQGVRWCIGENANSVVMNSKNGYVEGTSAPTPTNTWTNIVFTITGGKLKIYSNGTLYLDTGFSNSLNGTLYLGRNGAGNFKLSGGVSELIFENKAWTATEVAAYYNQTKGNYGL